MYDGTIDNNQYPVVFMQSASDLRVCRPNTSTKKIYRYDLDEDAVILGSAVSGGEQATEEIIESCGLEGVTAGSYRTVMPSKSNIAGKLVPVEP